MTNEEIVREYRVSKSKMTAIIRLAEQNDCPQEEIIEILRAGGVNGRELPRNRTQRREKKPFRLGEAARIYPRTTKEDYERMKKNVLGPDKEITLGKCAECGEFYDPGAPHICGRKNSFPEKAGGEEPKEKQGPAFLCPAIDGEPELTKEEAALCPACFPDAAAAPEKDPEPEDVGGGEEPEGAGDGKTEGGARKIGIVDITNSCIERLAYWQKRVEQLDADRRRAYEIRDALQRVVECLADAAELIGEEEE